MGVAGPVIRPKATLCLITALGWSAVAAGACSSNALAADRNTVFCLSQAHRGELIEAAVNLGLSAPVASSDRVWLSDGRNLDPAAWRAERPRDFDRACAAISQPPRAAQPNLLRTGLLPFGTAVLAAILTFIGTRIRDSTLRGEQQAQALRAAFSAFSAATESYLRQWRSNPQEQPSGRDVHERRVDLRIELRRVLLVRPRCPLPGQIMEVLSGDLGEAVTDGWRGHGRAGKDQRVREVLTCVEGLVLRLALALEHPVRQRATLRGDTPGDTPGDAPGDGPGAP